jgi:hypothetical protein
MAWTNGKILRNRQTLDSTRGPSLTLWSAMVYMAYLGEAGDDPWLFFEVRLSSRQLD